MKIAVFVRRRSKPRPRSRRDAPEDITAGRPVYLVDRVEGAYQIRKAELRQIIAAEHREGGGPWTTDD